MECSVKHQFHLRSTMKHFTLSLLLSFTLLFSSPASAVHVRHIGEVDLRDYSCQNTPESSFIDFICWSRQPQKHPNVLASLNWAVYGWCGVPEHVITGWRAATSKGKYFNSYVKGKYPCR